MSKDMNIENKTSIPTATDVYDKFFSNLETLSGIAERGASHSLLTIGMAVIAIALLTKIKIAEYSLLYLDTAEFIVFVIIGFLLMFSAALMRLYTFKVQMEMEKERNRLGAEILKGNQETAQGLTNNNKDIAKTSGL